jgi:hypothetical protein
VKKLVAIAVLGTMLIAAAPVTAHAHGAALGLAAFAAFTSLVALPVVAAAAVAPYAYPYGYPYAPYSYPYSYSAYPAPAYYAAPPSYAPAAPAVQREVVYPHGRHVLYGDGVRTAYQWVWVPNPPPPPAR